MIIHHKLSLKIHIPQMGEVAAKLFVVVRRGNESVFAWRLVSQTVRWRPKAVMNLDA